MTGMPLINFKMTEMPLFRLSHLEMTRMPLFLYNNDQNATVLMHICQQSSWHFLAFIMKIPISLLSVTALFFFTSKHVEDE
jgi:hypothetical protein